MKKLALCLCSLVALASAAFAGTDYSKESKNVPPPCPEWYADKEWNLNLAGVYVFTGSEWRDDRYLLSDHAWGGSVDLKYFFHRYFGIGIQGFGLSSNRHTTDFVVAPPVFINATGEDSRLVGGFLGTFTVRFPMHCSRFAPYIWGGGGVLFGGGDRDEVVFDGVGGVGAVPVNLFHTEHHDSSTEGIGQIGAGFEVRFTPHVGWTNDFSWNFVTRENSDFGMARTGINFAF
jgi:hypothetical protein